MQPLGAPVAFPGRPGYLSRGAPVEIVASLPYYRAAQTDAQRGEGIFDKSMEALRLLNQFGYGREGSGLLLNLVHNPVGAFLLPNRSRLRPNSGKSCAQNMAEFNHLYTITNMPVSRFLEFLLDSGNYQGYMERLTNAYNPAAVPGVMCRYTSQSAGTAYTV